ncbi:MAG: PBP1A family penicillin-binding protein [Acidimicrobiia bacterium]|nr:PBP1A family penicillin-binding protein [Acidimicrobiia bacterium]
MFRMTPLCNLSLSFSSSFCPDRPILRSVPSLSNRGIRLGVLVLAFSATAAAGMATGVFFVYADDLPEITALDDYRPNTITRLLAIDGRVIGDFATERRVVVAHDEIAPVLRQAIVAVEDGGFDQHVGFSIPRIIVTAVDDVLTGRRYGASTLTQQLARDVFLQQYRRNGIFERSGLRGIERKIKEAIVAVQLEKRYTKDEIFTFYANQIYFGHGAYGVEAAARMYFRKPARDVAVEEAAVLAAVIQSPSRISPFVNPDRALGRRNYVLDRMREEAFLSAEEAAGAKARPLVVADGPSTDLSIAPYFVEEIRKGLEQDFGAQAIYQAGLTVRTTLDADLQVIANAALDQGLRRLDKRHRGYQRPARNLIDEGIRPEKWSDPRWSRPIAPGDIVPAVVVQADTRQQNRGAAVVRIGATEVLLPPKAFAWTRRTASADLFRPGDVIEVQVVELAEGTPSALLLEQPPAADGALLAIDNRTGEIRAMVGGFSFARSKFNRATQARRQMGSGFKPVVYASAIDYGFTPATLLLDEPMSYPAGPDQPPYEPMNYDQEFEGPVTLRHALEQSRNIPAVTAMLETGPDNVLDYARRLGLSFAETTPPYLSLALGSAEATLLELTSAYAAFANQGIRMSPTAVRSVVDREGIVLQDARPEPHEAIGADTAFVMTSLLRGVVARGTATAARALQWPLAGKTGTTDDYSDAWFIGFDPDISVGVWIGYDEKKPLGRRETGASAALPVWMAFFEGYIDLRGNRDAPPRFEAPGNIVFATLESGITEAFINGTQPEGAVLATEAGQAASALPADAPATP